MQISKSDPGFSVRARMFAKQLARWFPTPAVIAPRATGIDISEASIKWITLAPSSGSYRVETYGEEPLEDGIVVNGIVENVDALALALAAVKERIGGVEYAHAALPEESAYVFEMHVPQGTPRTEVLHMIEFEFEARVPIPPDAAVFDFDVIEKRGEDGEDIAVVVFPRELAESYIAAFAAAGIGLLSLELEARSIARAISSDMPDGPVTLLVDFGRARTGFAVLKRGIPIFTSTVAVGGDGMTRALMEKLSLLPEEAVAFRNEQGLRPAGGAQAGIDAVTGVAAALADEVARHYHYWDTRRNEHGDRMTPVGQVILVGGSSNLNGLADYIAGRVQAPTAVGDIWRHMCAFDTYIPPITRRESLQYATAAGLALRSLPV
jgi:type IV pilus assembly protein PilM